MTKIKFVDWNKDMRKIQFIHLLNEKAGLSLQESKAIKDRIVDGDVVEIDVPYDIADSLVAEARGLGVLTEGTVQSTSTK